MIRYPSNLPLDSFASSEKSILRSFISLASLSRKEEVYVYSAALSLSMW